MTAISLQKQQQPRKQFSKVVWSHKRDDHATPDDLFRPLDGEYNFKLDAATSHDNPLGTPHFYYYRADALHNFTDGLKEYNRWRDPTFVNPPFSQSALWVARAYRERLNGITTVMVLASRTGTRWWHGFICACQGRPLPDNRTCTGTAPWCTVRLHDRRRKFGGSKNSAPFDSMVVIFHKVADRPATKAQALANA